MDDKKKTHRPPVRNLIPLPTENPRRAPLPPPPSLPVHQLAPVVVPQLPPAIEQALAAFARQLESQVNIQLKGMQTGMAQYVVHVVEHVVEERLRVHEEKLEAVLAAIKSDQKERAEYRARQEERTKAESDMRTAMAAMLGMQKTQAEVGLITANIHNVPREANQRYRLGLLTFLGAVIAALAALVGAMFQSRNR